MDNELIERARELSKRNLPNTFNMHDIPYVEMALSSRELVPALADALEAAQAENARMREALTDCRQAALGKWRDEWQEKYWSRLEAIDDIADTALEPRP